MERKISTPSLFLLIILVGFPQISETIYTPSLPDITNNLHASSNMVQLTLSIYFLGFAFGVFCWGRLSDSIGRRPAMLWGILVYGIGCLGCYLSDSVEWLLLSRFIQAFGASTGSVVTQTILRESIDGTKRHAVFAQISAALAFTPAIGPLIGGWVDQSLGFKAVFFTLVVISVAIFMYTFVSLPETRVSTPSNINTLSVAKRLVFDIRIWAFGFLIGATNGILFSYYAEAPFIFIEFFHMAPGVFGFFGVFVALSSILGAMLSKRLLTKFPAEKIILIGSMVTTLGAVCLTSFTLYGVNPSVISLSLMVAFIFTLLLGIGIAIPNCLSLALVHYSDVLGTAGAIFGLGYYVVVSLITSGMSYLHNGSLVTMPIYFLILAILMVLVSKKIIVNHKTK
ncbi:multidrug transporter CflA [Aneurinibacillus migulanus]|uniref:Bcr/CflA family efflux transporter n=1 Tax=Aneurinibacillus migulanus TaxID=47500 RepID=A0A0D1YH15_ANEMI|nr:multidrug effflux MFS transporter [Aneurinibacillus migulanus]KIV56358.1 multidrug transporter CflA [Aneurinibacillus migulanus]KIV58172.1 multidrug transporter CflA [Aneurinibacillus migulanus]KON96954.1 multidrug transporter CflA [Aneurinibacillus migulanus]KPD04564.1 multidrug transporter CflA [Aneurinibacillus migulanus]MED0896243.1 multidrug effflux MFS transporter [Aneurinibacillus migulanus]